VSAVKINWIRWNRIDKCLSKKK